MVSNHFLFFQADMPFRQGTFQLLTEGYPVTDMRLPRHFSPVRYELELLPVLEEGEFLTSGSVLVELEYLALEAAAEDATRLVIHSKYTRIDEANVTLISSGRDSATIVGHEYDLEKEFYVLHLAEELGSSDASYTLSMTFQSELLNDLRGLYYSTYEEDGVTKYLGVTQFEAIDARRAFPCLDEPEFKASFAMKIGRQEDLIAASNTPLLSTDPIEGMPGYVVDTFVETPTMSTYLVVLLIADFETTEAATNSDPDYVDFAIWHQPSKSGQADLAADAGPTLLKAYEDLFLVDFPLPKMDMAAIPDFDAGAMENWGLITYRESLLLYDPEKSSIEDYESVIRVVAHELAHQWFGDLVTMEWWDDLWLNEGFATAVEHMGADIYDPTLQADDRAVIEELQNVFEDDALISGAALTQAVNNPEYEVFAGGFEYTKGCSVVRMAKAFLTTEVFNEGITNYLNAFALDNANRGDLWTSLNDVAVSAGVLDGSLDVATILGPFTDMPGYPVVTVVSTGPRSATLSQKRFFLNPDTEDDVNPMWIIPITVYHPNDGSDDKAVFMENFVQTFTVGTSPYIINYRQDGYYRVNYDLDNWVALQELMATNPGSIDKLNRAQIYDDSFNLARAQQLDYSVPLELSKALSSEDEYIPMYSALKAIGFLDNMLRQDEGVYPLLQTYVKNLLVGTYNDLGFDAQPDDTYPTVMKRNLVVEWMCLYRYESCVAAAQSSFAAWMNETDPDAANPVNVNQRELIYEIAVREAEGREEFDFLLARLPNVVALGETSNILYGLGQTEDVALIEELLDLTVTAGSPIRSSDARYVYRSVGATAVGRGVQFNWLVENYGAIKEYFQDLFAGQVRKIPGIRK